jgi:hypothetical protein
MLPVLALLTGACGDSKEHPGDASADVPPALPVRLDPPTDSPRCGRWFCADQFPQSGSAVAVGDFDGDGRPDLLLADTGRVLATLGPLRLLHNDGEMHFSDVTARAGLAGYGAWKAIFGDLDNDGDEDLVLGGRRTSEPASEQGSVLVFYNNGSGRFGAPLEVQRWGAGVPMALDLADLDADGQLDIIAGVSGTNRRETYAPRVLMGQSDHTFAAQPGGLSDEGFTWIALATDLDGDQQPDVLITHDGHAVYQGTPEESGTVGCMADKGRGTGAWLNAAYRNEGAAGELRLVVQAVDAFWTNSDTTPMSLVRGDFDADGRMDLLATLTGNPMLFSVTSDGMLTARPDWPGTWRRNSPDNPERGIGWGALAYDVDRDGDVDALVAIGVIPPSRETWPNTVYLNDRAAGLNIAPEGTGLERPGEWSALAAADFDGDGDEDFVLGAQTLLLTPCAAARPRALLLTNVSEWPGRHWLRVRLVGTVSNRDGLGARVEAVNGAYTMVREVSRAGAIMSSSAGVVDFGLGEATAVDTLRVRWPSGAVQTLHAVAGDREVTVREPAWFAVDASAPRAGEPVTVRVSAAAIGAAAEGMQMEVGGQGRWIDPPAREPATGDLVGRFTGVGPAWVRTVGARPGPRAAVRVQFR